MEHQAVKMYIIKGEPAALARTRLNVDQGRVYDSQKSLKFLAGVCLRSQHDDQPLLTGPLHLQVTFFMDIPPTSKRKSAYHIYKPDLDNLIKFVCDVSNGIIFTDDCLVAKITATKIYDKNPRTEFTLHKIIEGDRNVLPKLS